MLSEIFILWFYEKKWKVFDVDTFEQLEEFDTKEEAHKWMKEQEVA